MDHRSNPLGRCAFDSGNAFENKPGFRRKPPDSKDEDLIGHAENRARRRNSREKTAAIAHRGKKILVNVIAGSVMSSVRWGLTNARLAKMRLPKDIQQDHSNNCNEPVTQND